MLTLLKQLLQSFKFIIFSSCFGGLLAILKSKIFTVISFILIKHSFRLWFPAFVVCRFIVKAAVFTHMQIVTALSALFTETESTLSINKVVAVMAIKGHKYKPVLISFKIAFLLRGAVLCLQLQEKSRKIISQLPQKSNVNYPI